MQNSEIDLALTTHKLVALEIAIAGDVSVDDVKIIPCPPVGEDCIYIKGKWSGYVDGWKEQGHVAQFPTKKAIKRRKSL